MARIPYGRHDINEADISAVVDVLRSDFLTQGSTVPNFEAAVARYCGSQHAVAVNSATSALHIACLALGVGKGDRVWTSPITFVASANCALYCGAEVDFVDIDIHTYNMSVERLEEKLVEARKINKLPKVVIPVHFAGQPSDLAGIQALGVEYGFKVIEDASHAIGGHYKGDRVGSCRYSDITVFSFHPVKIITTGEGGMALTNDVSLAKHMRRLRTHGISNTMDDMQPQATQEIWNYQQIDLGFNYRMNDIQAALGLSQLHRLQDFVTKRHAIAKRYDQLLAALPLQVPWQHKDSYSSYHLYVIRLKLNEINKTQLEIYNAMHREKIIVNVHYIPVYRHPYYENMGFKYGYCPQAEKYYSEAISIPLFSALTVMEQDRVTTAIEKVLVK